MSGSGGQKGSRRHTQITQCTPRDAAAADKRLTPPADGRLGVTDDCAYTSYNTTSEGQEEALG